MPKLIQTTTTETETTWKGLANLIKGGGGTLKIGDIITEKTLDGEEMDLVVVDMGPGWARFESKDCLPVEVAYNQNNRNAGGFADSDVKRYLNEEVFNSLPEELRNVIAEVERKQENGESSLCRLFLPTESELFGDCCYSEDDTYSQIEYYKDRRNRIKCNRKGGSPDWYWTASVGSGSSTHCVYVGDYGHSRGWYASYELLNGGQWEANMNQLKRENEMIAEANGTTPEAQAEATQAIASLILQNSLKEDQQHAKANNPAASS